MLAREAGLPNAASTEAGELARAAGERSPYGAARWSPTAASTGTAIRSSCRPPAAIARSRPPCLTTLLSDCPSRSGVGGAEEAGGSGLRGLADRVEALGGTLIVTSPPGAGTVVTAELPCES